MSTIFIDEELCLTIDHLLFEGYWEKAKEMLENTQLTNLQGIHAGVRMEQWGRIATYENNISGAMYYYLKAEQIYLQHGRKGEENLGVLYQLLADYYRLGGFFEYAYDYANKGLNLWLNHPDAGPTHLNTQIFAKMIVDIGVDQYWEEKKPELFEQSLLIYHDILDVIDRYPDSKSSSPMLKPFIVSIKVGLVWGYTILKQYEEAIELLKTIRSEPIVDATGDGAKIDWAMERLFRSTDTERNKRHLALYG